MLVPGSQHIFTHFFISSSSPSKLILFEYNVQAEMVTPAVEGTLNVLRSCKKNPFLKRVVLTSSSSTVRAREDLDPRVPIDESSWSSVELCERLQVHFFCFDTRENFYWKMGLVSGVEFLNFCTHPQALSTLYQWYTSCVNNCETP